MAIRKSGAGAGTDYAINFNKRAYYEQYKSQKLPKRFCCGGYVTNFGPGM